MAGKVSGVCILESWKYNPGQCTITAGDIILILLYLLLASRYLRSEICLIPWEHFLGFLEQVPKESFF